MRKGTLTRASGGSTQTYFVCLGASAVERGFMADHIYKKIELVGSSPKGIEEAVKNALSRAKKTIRNMRWFEIAETRGYLEDGKIAHWQVTLKVGFTLEG
jgi:dodecin